ncbi:hypothetical protein GCM10009753_72420 [Streptantibioticus ferralitis]
MLVAKQVMRIPSVSVIRNWALGWGRSLRTISRIPVGQSVRAVSGEFGDPGAVAALVPLDRRGPAGAGTFSTAWWICSGMTMPTE